MSNLKFSEHLSNFEGTLVTVQHLKHRQERDYGPTITEAKVTRWHMNSKGELVPLAMTEKQAEHTCRALVADWVPADSPNWHLPMLEWLKPVAVPPFEVELREGVPRSACWHVRLSEAWTD